MAIGHADCQQSHRYIHSITTNTSALSPTYQELGITILEVLVVVQEESDGQITGGHAVSLPGGSSGSSSSTISSSLQKVVYHRPIAENIRMKWPVSHVQWCRDTIAPIGGSD